MNRRSFIHSGVLSASAVGLGFNSCTNSAGDNKKAMDTESIIKKVRTAMFTMQRASWEQGVAAQSLLELEQFELAYMMAKEALLRQTDNGRLSVLYTDNGVTDPAASGISVKKMGEKYNDSALLKGAEDMLHYLLQEAPKNNEGTLYHTLNAPEIWIDSMYMAPPFIAVMGEYDEAIKQINGIRGVLWNEEARLFSHRWSDDTNSFPNKSFWGVGNGWAAVGMTQVLMELPDDFEEDSEILRKFIKQVVDGCLKYIREDGLFYNVVNDPSTFVETNLSQMLAYTVFRNVKMGWLSREYIAHAEKMRQAAHNKVDKHGYVQDVCGAPFFNAPGRATEGQAGFLLMEAAYRDFNRT